MRRQNRLEASPALVVKSVMDKHGCSDSARSLCSQFTKRHSLYRRLLPMPCAGSYVPAHLEQA
eukprot:2982586-Lingulodinium_polyedra.AAC.1